MKLDSGICVTLLALILLAGNSENVLAVTRYQSGTRQATPDPYFNPRVVKNESSDNVIVNKFAQQLKKNKVKNLGWPVPVENKNASTNSLWRPPLTPVQIQSSTFEVKNQFTLPISSPVKENTKQSFESLSTFDLQPKSSSDFAPASTTSSQITPTAPFSLPTSNELEIGSDSDTIAHVAENLPTPPVRPEPSPSVFEPTRVLAMVGNEPIFQGDILFEANQLIEQFMPTAPTAIKKTERKKLIKKLLPKYIDSRMMYLHVLQELPDGADIDNILEQAGKEFDAKAMPQMLKETHLNSPSDFDAQLRAQGSSLRKLRLSWSQDQLTKYFTAQEVKVDEEVSHQQMLDEYQKQLASYAIPARARWEQVMVRFDRFPNKQEAKSAIVEIGNQIVYGANLAAVAKKNSHGFRAEQGGQHDWTTQSALVLKELDKAIFTLPVGELSEIIETTAGFHVIRIKERNQASHQPFLEAQVEIKRRILEERRVNAFKKHLGELRKQTHVEYFGDNDLDSSATSPAGI